MAKFTAVWLILTSVAIIVCAFELHFMLNEKKRTMTLGETLSLASTNQATIELASAFNDKLILNLLEKQDVDGAVDIIDIKLDSEVVVLGSSLENMDATSRRAVMVLFASIQKMRDQYPRTYTGKELQLENQVDVILKYCATNAPAEK